MSALTHEDLIWGQVECERVARECRGYMQEAIKRGDAEMQERWASHVRTQQQRADRFSTAARAMAKQMARVPRKRRAHG